MTSPPLGERLAVADAAVPAECDHLHIGRRPALVTRRGGAGRITWVGPVPGRDLARSLADWLAPDRSAPTPRSGRRDLIVGFGPPVHVCRSRGGSRPVLGCGSLNYRSVPVA
ncbi:hypothetical protein AB0I68_19695 [Streptomyces sp. NPDC050448]|uniref:hypothetical protein n=1 Tax=Streptomyces sp. NPDC050448 TaxID=3155404 RepID=UPI003435B362